MRGESGQERKRERGIRPRALARLETLEREERARSETKLLDFRADYLKIVEGTLSYIILEEEAVERLL